MPAILFSVGYVCVYRVMQHVISRGLHSNVGCYPSFNVDTGKKMQCSCNIRCSFAVSLKCERASWLWRCRSPLPSVSLKCERASWLWRSRSPLPSVSLKCVRASWFWRCRSPLPSVSLKCERASWLWRSRSPLPSVRHAKWLRELQSGCLERDSFRSSLQSSLGLVALTSLVDILPSCLEALGTREHPEHVKPPMASVKAAPVISSKTPMCRSCFRRMYVRSFVQTSICADCVEAHSLDIFLWISIFHTGRDGLSLRFCCSDRRLGRQVAVISHYLSVAQTICPQSQCQWDVR